jgi:hypothetical protein
MSLIFAERRTLGKCEVLYFLSVEGISGLGYNFLYGFPISHSLSSTFF